MLNLFINYDCNFNCDYCFIKGFADKYPLQILKEDFERLLIWLKNNNVYALGILGGEPTLHPDFYVLLEKLAQSGISTVLFTNGLFARELCDVLSDVTANIVVNYNDPSMYTNEQWDKLQGNLARLKESGTNFSFSKNFSREKMRFEYLLEGCERFGVTKIRYDISRPNPLVANNYYDLNDSKALGSDIFNFVKTCESRGILTGLDCCLPVCSFDTEALEYLKMVSMKFSSLCWPSLDIHTDLSISYCAPLQKINATDVTTFGGEWELLSYFAEKIREIRHQRKNECVDCNLSISQCQGGCLALKDIDV